MKIIRTLRIALVLLAAAAEACSEPKPPARKPLEAIVLIGSDGFSAEVMRRNADAFPNIRALMARGLSTTEARSVLPSSSAINWATLLMGAGSEMHGFTTWGSQSPEVDPVTVNEWGLFPGIFGEVRRQRPDAVTGVFYSWDGIGYLYEQAAVTRSFHSGEDDELLCREACRFIEERKPVLTFICLAEPDLTGHESGWESEEYFAMCRTVDSLVGQVVATVDRSLDPARTAIVFTADHGGIERGHGGKTMSEMLVPYILVGPGIPAGETFRHEVMKYDNAPTIADLLGLEAPDVWRGKSALR